MPCWPFPFQGKKERLRLQVSIFDMLTRKNFRWGALLLLSALAAVQWKGPERPRPIETRMLGFRSCTNYAILSASHDPVREKHAIPAQRPAGLIATQPLENAITASLNLADPQLPPAIAARAFLVPQSLEELPLPIFVLDATNASAPSYSCGFQLTESEKVIFKSAGESFFSGLKAAPVHDAADPVYEDWWNASRLRSDEYLISMLGADRVIELLRHQPDPSSADPP